MSKFKKYRTQEVSDLFEDAQEFYGDVSKSAQEFLDDMEERVKFAVDEEVEFVELSEAQFEWLEKLATWDEHRSGYQS